MDTSARMEGKILSNRYLLGEEIGVGGMGSVYAATDLRTGGAVAVKIPHPFLTRDPDYVRRLRREAQIAASLYSPRVVRVMDLDTHEGLTFLVMEYVPGETLADLLRARGRFSLAETLSIGLEVARALDAAYQQGIVHRDLKPQNIKVVEGEVKVLDFGIAKTDALGGITSASTIVGTPEYCAPERMDGLDDIRSDIYSLGVILFQMREGQLPFHALTPFALLRKHETEPPPPLSGSVPAAVQTILDRCLAKDPDGRYQTPAELIQAIRAITDAPAISQAPPTLPLDESARGLEAAASPPTIPYEAISVAVAPTVPAPPAPVSPPEPPLTAPPRRRLAPLLLAAPLLLIAVAAVAFVLLRPGDAPGATGVPAASPAALDFPAGVSPPPVGTVARLAASPAPVRPLVAPGERVNLDAPAFEILPPGCPGVRIVFQVRSIELERSGRTRLAYAVRAPRVDGVLCSIDFPANADCRCTALRTRLRSDRVVESRNTGGDGVSVSGNPELYGAPEQRGEWWFDAVDFDGELLTVVRLLAGTDTVLFEIPLLQR